MKTTLAALTVAAVLTPAATGAQPITPTAEPSSPPICNHKCQFKRDHRKLRKATSHNPIPSYIVDCESGGDYRALNPTSHAGGKYQILPSTWASEIDRLRHYIVRLAGGNRGPRWSSRLLQDIIGAAIWEDSGPGAWSCA